jgi:hypothetical protein
MSVVQPKIKISESERKQIYRAKLREQLGEAEYKKQQNEKKRAYRAKIKAIKNPEQKTWLRFFLSINFSLIFYLGVIAVDLWSIYLHPRS